VPGWIQQSQRHTRQAGSILQISQTIEQRLKDHAGRQRTPSMPASNASKQPPGGVLEGKQIRSALQAGTKRFNNDARPSEPWRGLVSVTWNA